MDFFVLGDEDVILGFQFAGIKGLVITTREEAVIEFDRTINKDHGDIGVLLLTEKVATMLEDRVMKWQIEGEYPLIVEIPDLEGHLEGKKSMLDSIREAIGIHI